MKTTTCPCCGKQLIDLSTEEDKSLFWCDECCLDIDIWPDAETPVSISDELVRIDWVNIGEGLCGDYNSEDPEDINILRFDVSYNPYYAPCTVSDSIDWEEVEDASYCTTVPSDTEISELVRLAYIIHKEYRAVMEDYPEASVKKLGERMSHIQSIG